MSDDNNSYAFLCPDCGSLNHVPNVEAFRPRYERKECWQCGTVSEVDTETRFATTLTDARE